jgi:GNAT superfamily N-acetyltransferase
MTTSEILELYDRHERRGADYPGYSRVEAGKTIRMLNGEAGGHNCLIYSRLSADDADGAIEAELDWFRGLGRGFEWKLYSHDNPPDLKERLARHGFSIGEDEAIMALELAGLPAALAADHPHDVRKVGEGASFADYAAVDAIAWPENHESYIREIEATLRDSPERMSAWVAYVEGKPVCAARVDFPEASPFASLWGGTTLEPYRKRGIYTAMLSARAKEAIGRGYRFLTIDASPMSRPIVERQGFRLLSVSNPCDSPR